jgi:anti-anti-sigma regulatory factor
MTISKKHELHIKTEYSGTGGELHLNGPLSIQHAKHIKEALMDALNRKTPLLVTCSNTSQLDLAVLQLFIAATKTAAQSGTQITFNVNIPASLQPILQHANMDEYVRPA